MLPQPSANAQPLKFRGVPLEPTPPRRSGGVAGRAGLLIAVIIVAFYAIDFLVR